MAIGDPQTPRPLPNAADVLTLAAYAEVVVADQIFSGELPPGSRVLPPEVARQLGMSTIPVREALRGLASRGLVDATARRGFRVRPADRRDFAETYQLRLLLDPFAVTLAVPQMTDADLAAMDAALDRLDHTITAHDSVSYYADHKAFHFSVYEPCGSAWLLKMIGMLWENSHRYQRMSTGPRGSDEERVAEHRAIAEACHARDAEKAAELMRVHLDRTRTVVERVLGSDWGKTERDGKDRLR